MEIWVVRGRGCSADLLEPGPGPLRWVRAGQLGVPRSPGSFSEAGYEPRARPYGAGSVAGFLGRWVPSSKRDSEQRRANLKGISGLVVEYIVAIDVTRVRFPADAFFVSAPGIEIGYSNDENLTMSGNRFRSYWCVVVGKLPENARLLAGPRPPLALRALTVGSAAGSYACFVLQSGGLGSNAENPHFLQNGHTGD